MHSHLSPSQASHLYNCWHWNRIRQDDGTAPAATLAYFLLTVFINCPLGKTDQSSRLARFELQHTTGHLLNLHHFCVLSVSRCNDSGTRPYTRFAYTLNQALFFRRWICQPEKDITETFESVRAISA